MTLFSRSTVAFSSKLIASSGVAYSNHISLVTSSGSATVHIKVEGDGTATVRYLLGPPIAGVTLPTDHLKKPGEDATDGDIATGLTKTGGPNSDGEYFLNSSIIYGELFQLVVDETSTTDSVTITANVITI